MPVHTYNIVSINQHVSLTKVHAVRMRIHTNFCHLFFFVTLLLFTAQIAHGANSGQTKKTVLTRAYVSKDYIDTSIQRAFYMLNEAASVAGIGFKQKQAVDEAKSIARRLREGAKGDPNERYILWKVSELESQIYLEEKDLVLSQMQQGQISINQLVERYNQEVGKPRPDFAAMRRLHVQMERLDNAKANQMANSYNKRYRSISNEAVMSMERTLEAGDLENAREELGYCLRNASYLSISSSTYAKFEKRVEKLAAARYEKPLIEEETATAMTALARNNLSIARDSLSHAETRLAAIRTHLPENEINSLSSKINDCINKLTFKEDSIVKINMSILSRDGVSAADNFLRTVVLPSGVSVEKTALIDKAILGVRSPEDSKIHDELGTLSSDEQSDSQQSAVLDDIKTRAKIKAQKKTDSLRAIEEETLRIAMAEQRRQNSIAEAARAAELIEFQKKQQNAQSIYLDIFSLLEKSSPEPAQKRFNKERQFLLKFLDKEEFYILESTLQQFSIASDKPDQKNTMTPSNQKVTSNFATSPTSVGVSMSTSQGSVPAVKGYSGSLPKEIENKLQQNQERAEQEIAQIYSLLEKNQVIEAYNRFKKFRNPLQNFLHAEVFSMLESTVSQAWEFHQSRSSGR